MICQGLQRVRAAFLQNLSSLAGQRLVSHPLQGIGAWQWRASAGSRVAKSC